MIQHLDGNCHVYLDDEADADKALRIVENSKTQRYGTCQYSRIAARGTFTGTGSAAARGRHAHGQGR